MFKGMVEHQLDDKNRLRIPSRFKKELAGEHGERPYCFFRGAGGCIYVMAEEELDETLAPIAQPGLSECSKGSKLIFSSIHQAEEDAQGRVVLPNMLKKLAGIKKDIITIGQGNRLEIWSAERYYEFLADVDFDEELKAMRI